jgi:sulfatase maturation enzyme AslB (radical SAM superfamily)
MSSLASPRAAPAGADPAWPAQPLHHLDALWIQVAGTLCNLSCTHCFVSCGPGDLHHALMSRDEVSARVREGLALGVREFYFTGGEPFMHPAMLEVLEDTLPFAPCTVLTNGTLFTRERLARLRQMREASRYSLEIRVSLDGATADEHDRFRGPGSFANALEGLRGLEANGMLPIVTATHSTDEDELSFRTRYLELLRSAGLARPRLKVLPMFRLGRETTRSRDYEAFETLRDLPAEAFDPQRLQCGHCRAVTAKGVFVCPLLVDEPDGRLGDRLADARAPYRLSHGACYTCYVTGMTCANG